jgi:hypothetical protein
LIGLCVHRYPQKPAESSAEVVMASRANRHGERSEAIPSRVGKPSQLPWRAARMVMASGAKPSPRALASRANCHGERSEWSWRAKRSHLLAHWQAEPIVMASGANGHGERSEAIPSRVKNASLEMASSLRSSP